MNNEAELNLPLLSKEDGSVERAGTVLCSGADTAHIREKGVDFSNPY